MAIRVFISSIGFLGNDLTIHILIKVVTTLGRWPDIKTRRSTFVIGIVHLGSQVYFALGLYYRLQGGRVENTPRGGSLN